MFARICAKNGIIKWADFFFFFWIEKWADFYFAFIMLTIIKCYNLYILRGFRKLVMPSC